MIFEIKTKEIINKMIEKYSWLGKEYCRLIENENPYKSNQQVFEEMANKVLKDLDRLEELEKENQELKARCKAIPPLAIKNEKLVKAIELLKDMFSINLWVDDMDCYIRIGKCDYLISWEQYKILSEVLG